MKITLLQLSIISIFVCQTGIAREFNSYEDIASYSNNSKSNFNEKKYEDKIQFLEIELAKYKTKLVEKSLSLEKTQEEMQTKYDQEIAYLKRDNNYKTKSLLEAQRQLEKINPSEDMKTLVKVNTELASEIRKNQDQMAMSQLKFSNENTKGRFPASVKSK